MATELHTFTGNEVIATELPELLNRNFNYVNVKNTLGDVATEDIVPITKGGTDATTVANARTNLGLNKAVTGASISGKVITLTFADGTTKTLTTQDNGYHTGNATSIGGASATKPAVVVTTYKSGTSWYRVWSDGWVEQGGYFAVNGGSQTITFPKAFKDTNYTLVDGYMSSSTSASMPHREVAIAASRTATNFVAYTTSSSYGVGKWWYACGQGA